MRKTDIFKNYQKSKFLRKKIRKNELALNSKKGTRYIRGNVYFGIIVFSCLSSIKLCLRFFLYFFAFKRLLFLQNEVDFRGIRNISLNILTKNYNFKKLTHVWGDERAVINTRKGVLLENPCIFLLAKEKPLKRIFNTNSELLQSGTEKQIVLSKTTINRLFNNIWCYLFIACFDKKKLPTFQLAVFFVLKRVANTKI